MPPAHNEDGQRQRPLRVDAASDGQRRGTPRVDAASDGQRHRPPRVDAAADRQRHRPLRVDAAANRERVLAAAAAAIKRDGEKVPMAEIAAAAGVGIGTLYRRYPTREDLLEALSERSYELVLQHARAAAISRSSATTALTRFFAQTIGARDALILPLHGGPVSLDAHVIALRTQISDHLEQVLARGRADGSIRGDVSAIDIIIMGAMLAQPLPHIPDWDRLARRQAAVYIAGLRPSDGRPLPGRRPTRRQLESGFHQAASRSDARSSS